MATTNDPPRTAIIGRFGLHAVISAFPLSGQTTLAEPPGFTSASPTLRPHLLAAGPAALDLRLTSTAPASDLWAVLPALTGRR